jgi:hypothetical protein
MSGLATLDPIANPQAWDAILVAGHQSPGVCFLSGFKREQVFDKKKGKGTKGNTLTYVQGPSVEGTIKFLLWDNGTGATGHNHFAEWDAFVPFLQYDPTKKKVQAIDLFHPALAAISATSFVCEEIGACEQEGEPGQQLYSITIKLCEYYPPSKSSAVGTPSTSVAGTVPGGGAGVPANTNAQDAQQQQIAALMAQASAP